MARAGFACSGTARSAPMRRRPWSAPGSSNTSRGTAALKPELDKRNTTMIGLSVDPLASHTKWAADIAETQGTAVNFPMIADADRKVSLAYDMIHPQAEATATVRSVFIVGPDKKVKLS